MGAIGGIVKLEGAQVDRAPLETMQGELARYGADSQSIRICGSVGMLSCRLAITKEDRQDHQPLESGEHQAIRIMVFDGRLDNRDELKAWLGLDSATVDQMADSACRGCSATTPMHGGIVVKSGSAWPAILPVFVRCSGRETARCWHSPPCL